jgi:hypothetical protein
MYRIGCILFAILSVLVANEDNWFLKNGGVQYDKRGRLSVGSVAPIGVKVDAGWYSFIYGGVNKPAYRSFTIKNSNLVIFRLQAAFCPDNYFAAYDNGIPLFNTNTNPVQTSLFGCTDLTADPNSSIIDETHFSFGTSVLLPGTHNITIVATQSPYGGGTAFIRADSACSVPGSLPEPCLLPAAWSHAIVM